MGTVATYSPGAWFALVAPSAAVMVDPELPGDSLDELWQALRSGDGADRALSVLTGRPQRAATSFALVCVESHGVRLVVRGRIGVTVQDRDGQVREVRSTRAAGWHRERLSTTDTVWLVRPGAAADGAALPVVQAAVLADVLTWQPMTGTVWTGTSHEVPEPDEVDEAEAGPEVAAPPEPAERVEAAESAEPVESAVPAEPTPASCAGVLVMSDGRRLPVTGPIVIGRAPRERSASPDRQAMLVTMASNGRGLSRSHLRVDVGVGGAFVIDLDSRNGTMITAAGGVPTRLDPWMPHGLRPGMTVTFAEASFTYEEA